MKNQSYIFLILIVLAGTSCEKKIDIEADKLALISFTTVEWDKYVLARDIEAMADYYTEDAVRIENDGQILSGKESIRNEFRNRMKNNTLIKLYNEAEDVWISDDLGVVRGKYSVRNSNSSICCNTPFPFDYETNSCLWAPIALDN